MKYGINDFINDTPPRLIGSETEYTTGTKVDAESKRFFENIPVAKILAPTAPDNDISVWLKNGAHIYQDAGYVHEYASPECTSATELLHYEKAGEEIIQAASSATLPTPLDRVYKRTGYASTFSEDGTEILKEMSVGHHENYYFPFIDLLRDNSLAQRELNSYLTTRAIWSGTGLVSEGGFDISQKALAIDFAERSLTDHGEKTPYRVHEKESRLEIRTGEGNMSDWAIVQKFAMTSLVLRLIEHGKFPGHLGVTLDPTYTMRIASRYPNFPIVTVDGLTKPAHHQRQIAEHALDFAEHQPEVPYEEILAAEAVIQACTQIDDYFDDGLGLESISNRIDWAGKYHHMLQHGIDKEDIHTANLNAVMLDLKWEDISARGISRIWYKRKNSVQAKPANIERAHYIPPATRAQERNRIVSDLKAEYGVNFITWDKIDNDLAMTSLPDPYGNNLNESL